MFAKLVAVGLLVALHALIGHTVVQMSERRGDYIPPSPLPLVCAMIATMTGVLLLVLAKPAMPDLTPDWLETPQNNHLPLEATPT
jgi:uncharacterized membrane protein YidH (DUF202 family)